MLATRRFLVLSALVTGALALAACSPSAPAPNSETPANQAAPAATVAAPTTTPPVVPTEPVSNGTASIAHAVLEPTQGNTAAGALTLHAEPNGVRISGQISGLQPDSEHGFHVHANGDCSAPDASSAGGHFDPAAQPHGHADSGPHHAGDMSNLRANAQGVAEVNVLVHDASLEAGNDNNVVGRALIVHADADDYYSQPAGNAGPRIACGVITADSNADLH